MTKNDFLEYIKDGRQFKYNWVNELGKNMPERIMTIKPVGTDGYILTLSDWYDEMRFEIKSVFDTYFDTYILSADYDNYGVISEPRLFFSQLTVILTTVEKIARFEKLISDSRSTDEEVQLYKKALDKLNNM